MDTKYTIEEISKILKVSTKTVLREIKRGKIKPEKAGRRFIVSQKEIDMYLGKSGSTIENKINQFLKDHNSDMVTLLQRMVSIESISGESGSELKLAQIIQDKLTEWGIRNVIYRENNAVALHATYGFSEKGIILDCPLDTLPPGDINKWSHPPFDGVIESGKMYGRGTADCKAGIVTMLYTVLFIKKNFDETKLRLELIFDGGEQDGKFSGMREVLKKNIKADGGIIGYAGGMDEIMIGARGYHRFKFKINGKSVHTGSRFKRGVNAVSKAADFIKAIEKISLPVSKSKYFDFGNRITVSQIEGGRAINMVPDECTVKVDFRVVPEVNLELLEKQINSLIEDLVAKDKDLDIGFEYMTGQEAYLIPDKYDLAKSLKEEVEKELNVKLPFVVSGPAHVGNLLWERGIPMLVFGPKGENVHSYDEYVEVSSIPETSKIYSLSIVKYFNLT